MTLATATATAMGSRPAPGGGDPGQPSAVGVSNGEYPSRLACASSPFRRTYLRCLAIAFTAFNSIRILTYLPTIWSIHAVGHSDQYSLWTWVAWIGGNASMAAWLYENNGQRCNAAVAVTAANTLMCLATCLTIAYYRI